MSPPSRRARGGFAVGRPSGPRDRQRRLIRFVRGYLVRRMLLAGALLVALCLLQVWVRLQVMDLGYELSAARQMQLRLTHERRELEVELATLRSPGRIAEFARERLGMEEPRGGQVIMLTPAEPRDRGGAG